MNLQLNGNTREIEEKSLHVLDLLRDLQLEGQPVVVEVNGNALLPREFESTSLKDGDQIELVRVVAGG